MHFIQFSLMRTSLQREYLFFLKTEMIIQPWIIVQLYDGLLFLVLVRAWSSDCVTKLSIVKGPNSLRGQHWQAIVHVCQNQLSQNVLSQLQIPQPLNKPSWCKLNPCVSFYLLNIIYTQSGQTFEGISLVVQGTTKPYILVVRTAKFVGRNNATE